MRDAKGRDKLHVITLDAATRITKQAKRTKQNRETHKALTKSKDVKRGKREGKGQIAIDLINLSSRTNMAYLESF